MSTPKKPGSDLSALKARLAKKAAAEAPPAEVPAPVPAPGQVIRPAPPQPVAEIPAPGEVRAPPPEELPAPGQVIQPAAPEPADPLQGGAAFDPNAGVIEGGEAVPARSGKGIVIFAALIALFLGAIVGYLMNRITGTRERVEVGKAKGAQMHAEVAKVSDSRKTISLEMTTLQETIAKDPTKGSEAITNLLSEQFDTHPKIDELFGWQLASVHSTGIRKAFDLYEEANGLKLDLGYLAGFLADYGAALDEAKGGPQVFAIQFTERGPVLVEAVQPVCVMDPPTPCQDGNKADAVGYSIATAIGGAPEIVPKGTEPGMAMLLRPEGDIYNYAVGLEPNKNALKVYASLLKKVMARLEAMNKAERLALAALENYAENPTVDASNPQPEPVDPGE